MNKKAILTVAPRVLTAALNISDEVKFVDARVNFETGCIDFVVMHPGLDSVPEMYGYPFTTLEKLQ